MTSITNLSSSQVKTSLLKSESYAYFDLPPYFRFDLVIDKVVRKVGASRLSDFYDSTVKPKSLDDVNYKIMGNKDGKYDWRPFQLIHPALYVCLVNIITSASVGMNDFELSPFHEKGGAIKANRVFEQQLDKLLDEMNKELVP